MVLDGFAAAVGKFQVKQNHIRLQVANGTARFGETGGVSDDAEVRTRFQNGGQPFAHDRMVIDE